MFHNEFYPTPLSVIQKMVRPIMGTHRAITAKAILEPSAGKGDILDDIRKYYHVRQEHCFAIEVNPELRATLRGKGYKVIGDDFLQFDELYGFDLILMNPPFSNGVDHLLHAWDILNDGDVVCVLNAETINNPHTKKRELLKQLIEDHGSVEHIGKAFQDADRKTMVDCVIVHLSKSKSAHGFKHTDFDFEAKFNSTEVQNNPLAHADAIESIVSQYEAAAKATQALHRAQSQVNFYTSGIRSENDARLAQSKELPSLNQAIVELKRNFWMYVFEKTRLGNRATSKFRDNFQKFTNETSQMAFNKHNIVTVLEMFFINQDKIMRDCAIEVFDKATAYHEKNKVHVEGWKTNKSWKVGAKFIMPDAIRYEPKYNSWSFTWRQNSVDFFNDLDRVCCFLDGKSYEDMARPYSYERDMQKHPPQRILDAIEDRIHRRDGKPYNDPIYSRYFEIRIFKKGTVHLKWRDEALLARFNQEAAQGKNWVGPGY